MKPKTILTAVLAIFVVASVLYLVMGETRRDARVAEPEGGGVDSSAQAAAAAGHGCTFDSSAADAGGAAGSAAKESAGTPANAIVAYYFHGTRRCPTCRKLEEYTNEAITTGFAEELRERRLVWRVVNVEDPEHEHFINDYRLSTKSVVLSEIVDGSEIRWKNLPRIWELVGDKGAFISYIQAEVKGFEGGGS